MRGGVGAQKSPRTGCPISRAFFAREVGIYTSEHMPASIRDFADNAVDPKVRGYLPYRQTRSFGPPGPGDAARDRAGLKSALAAMRKIISGRLFLGGHSYGG